MAIRTDAIARLAAYAEALDFPATKRDLLLMAEEQQFPDIVMDMLEDLPAGEYDREADLIEVARLVARPSERVA